MKKKTMILCGAHRWDRYKVIRDALQSQMQVVLLVDEADFMPVPPLLEHFCTAIERGPMAADQATPLIERLQQRFRHGWHTLALDDFTADFAATLSAASQSGCFPLASSQAVNRKHRLRKMWNELCREPEFAAHLHPVAYEYYEFANFAADNAQVTASDDFSSLPEQTSFVIKPDELSASIEVATADNRTAARKKAREIRDLLHQRWVQVGQYAGVEIRPRVLIEQSIPRATGSPWHPGAEYSAEFLSFAGKHYLLGVTQKWIDPQFVEVGHLFPAETMPADLASMASKAVNVLMNRLQVDYTVSHWEFIVTPDRKLALVEGHLRPAGDNIIDLIELSSGNSPMLALFHALAGQSLVIPESFRSVGIFWLAPERPLHKITRVEIEPTLVRDPFDGPFIHIDQEALLQEVMWTGGTNWLNRHVKMIVCGAHAQDVYERCHATAAAIHLFGHDENSEDEVQTQMRVQAAI